MISVLTLTYKRHHILEEAIESFLRQNIPHPKEMVIINDCKDIDYVFDHPEVRIINHKERFPSISDKLRFGFQQCKYDYIYRLDDDDLLSPTGLSTACVDILENPGYDVYRSKGFYFFVNNESHGLSSNVNNGNIYKKEYINNINWPNVSVGEDTHITFHQGGRWYEPANKPPTMIYRWGMQTFHLSGAGTRPNEIALQQADESLHRINSSLGTIQLFPHFKQEYYNKLYKVYIQLGANTGHDEFQNMVESSKEKLKIFLLEPNTDLLPELANTYSEISKKHDVTICPFGIGLSTGEQDLYQYANINGNYSLLNRKHHPLKDVATSKKIEIKTFEEFCKEFGIQQIDCLFMDTEGMDYEILNSIDLDKMDIKTIIFEQWDHEDDDMNNLYRTGPTFLKEVIVPKYSNYKWEEFVSGGMNNFKLTKK